MGRPRGTNKQRGVSYFVEDVRTSKHTQKKFSKCRDHSSSSTVLLNTFMRQANTRVPPAFSPQFYGLQPQNSFVLATLLAQGALPYIFVVS